MLGLTRQALRFGIGRRSAVRGVLYCKRVDLLVLVFNLTLNLPNVGL